ncbi:alpha/beta hydrolase [Veronia nyctiphanis]|uniref:Alpha/beta hydrolase n=2 Tax=Veronia nyctiphanis TaxID=1278244 RepID=A0A4Q0YSG1_9GAMM|nr:alpha/beta hydrolase [Veronia nyctiphanis]
MNCLRVGAGPTLVLVHGFLSGLTYWDKQVELFSASFDVVVFDLPGFGSNAEQTCPDTIENFADYVINKLSRLGIEEFHLIGHSMGGMIAQEIAIKIPDRVIGLVLYATGPVGSLPGRFEPIEYSIERVKTEGTHEVARDTVKTWFTEGEDDPDYASGIAMADQVKTESYINGLLAMSRWRALERLDKVEAKTLIIWPDSDRSYMWEQIESLWRGIKATNLAVVPQAAHNLHLEKSRIFNLLVVDFLKSDEVQHRLRCEECRPGDLV